MRGQDYYDRGVDLFCHCRLTDAKVCFTSAASGYLDTAKFDKKHADVCKLNAAICFYWAANFNACVEVIDKIQLTKLTGNLYLLCEELLKEARKRRHSSHWDGVNAEFVEMRQRGMHKDILALMKANPYFLPDKIRAFQLRESTLALGMTEVAMLFDQDYQKLQ